MRIELLYAMLFQNIGKGGQRYRLCQAYSLSRGLKTLENSHLHSFQIETLYKARKRRTAEQVWYVQLLFFITKVYLKIFSRKGKYESVKG